MQVVEMIVSPPYEHPYMHAYTRIHTRRDGCARAATWLRLRAVSSPPAGSSPVADGGVRASVQWSHALV